MVELYLVKGKIHKHLFEFSAAEACVSQARVLDQADRYLNNKGIKYALQAQSLAKAEALFKIFMREENNVHDLQTMWMENWTARALVKQQRFDAGLRHYKFVEKHLTDMQDDQIDFQSYCLRKYTLRSFVELIAYANSLHLHQQFVVAAAGIVRGLIAYGKFNGFQKAENDRKNQEFKKLTKKEQNKIKKKLAKEKESANQNE